MKRIIIALLFLMTSIATLSVAEYKYHDSGTFYSSAISSVSFTETYTTDSDAIDVRYTDAISVHAYAIYSSTSGTANITVSFITSPDGTIWDTDAFTSFTFVATSSLTYTCHGELIDTAGIKKIKVTSIQNGNSTGALLNSNIYWARKE